MATDPDPVPSTFGRLLEEISWEGNARRYRGGGLGKENVLTAEVFSALDFLPRDIFLGDIIRHAHDGSTAVKTAVAATAENAQVTVLPGDIHPHDSQGQPLGWRLQPDVIIETDATVCFVEAKRIQTSQFQEHQLLRTLHALHSYANGRNALMLVITAQPPPYRVQRHGRLTIGESIHRSLDTVTHTEDQTTLRLLADTSICWITWQDIAVLASEAAGGLTDVPGPVQGTVDRLSASIGDAIQRHA